MMKIGNDDFEQDAEKALLVVNEDSPLLIRHMSMEKQSRSSSQRAPERCHSRYNKTRDIVATPGRRVIVLVITVIVTLVLAFAAWLASGGDNNNGSLSIVTIDKAHEQYVEVDPGISLWLRTWGNRQNGIPVLFVHGGPGNAIADYDNSNADFFRAQDYFVVEVDQRGTGNSQPSVRTSALNMAYYDDISVDQIAADYEKVRAALHIDQWLVFGGSFGSTVGLYYATHYPQACLGLIIRGIYLDTPTEMQAVYARSSHVQYPSRLQAFDILYNYAAAAATAATAAALSPNDDDEPLDPNNAETLTAAYAKLIRNGDRQAIWHWHVYENNLMETDPRNLLDPSVIDETVFPEAQSVAFFETRLWLRGAYEHPLQLLHSIHHLRHVPFVQICQGRHDLVCPAKYTRWLTDALDAAQAMYGVRYIDSGHEQSDPVMARCLQESLSSFVNEYHHQSIKVVGQE